MFAKGLILLSSHSFFPFFFFFFFFWSFLSSDNLGSHTASGRS